jgi:hypothetical protein
MPQPAYIVCSKDGSVDRFTNAPSSFGLLETFRIANVEVLKEAPKDVEAHIKENSFLCRFIAAWFKDKHDAPDVEFASDLRIYHEPFGGGEQTEMLTAEFPNFKFTKHVHRLIQSEMPIPACPLVGFIVIENRIKRVGEADWEKSQSYRIILNIVEFKEGPKVVSPALKYGSH